jgi:hypothetical protein
MQLMQPSFALVCDKRIKCFLLFIRGAISTEERLTSATAAEVPFHHISLSEGQINNVVLGYAHCGMLVAAGWIATLALPHLHSKVQEFPDFQIKVILTNFMCVNETIRYELYCSQLCGRDDPMFFLKKILVILVILWAIVRVIEIILVPNL